MRDLKILKTPEELIREGYNAEGALVFLRGFIEEEKQKQLHQLMTCPADKIIEHRAVVKYINSLEPYLLEKIRTGILQVAEQVERNTRQED